MAKAVTSNKISISIARAAFVTLETPEFFNPTAPGPNEKKKYRMSLLLDPSNEAHAKTIKEIKSEAKRIAAETFGAGSIPKSLELCFGNGNDLDKVYDGFADMFYIKTSSADRVPTVGRRKNSEGKFTPTGPGDEEFPYGGCYVNAKITLWCQTTHGRKAINANLLTIQFVKDGDQFGRPAADPNAEFEGLEEGADEGAESADADDQFG